MMDGDKNTKKQVDAVVKAILALKEERMRHMLMRTFEIYVARLERGEKDSGPSARNEIEMYLHCRECLEQARIKGIPESPERYSRISAGFTKRGIQIWCHRHDLNILHMDFEGVQHPANSGVNLEDDA
jgi:hypothetical protein